MEGKRHEVMAEKQDLMKNLLAVKHQQIYFNANILKSTLVLHYITSVTRVCSKLMLCLFKTFKWILTSSINSTYLDQESITGYFTVTTGSGTLQKTTNPRFNAIYSFLVL